MDYKSFSAGTWVILYFGVWFLSITWSVVTSLLSRKHPKIGEAREGGIATLSLIAGGIAVAFVTIGLKADIGLFILLVLSAGAASVGVSSYKIGDKLMERR